MADYHIIEGNDKGEYRIVFHVNVPNEMNRAGTINIRQAVKEDAGVRKVSIIPWITMEEQEKLTNGELIEIPEAFRPDESKSLIENRRVADGRFRELQGVVSSNLRTRYGLWRFSRDVNG